MILKSVNKMFLYAFICACALFVVKPANAQVQEGSSLDKIVAVVGDNIITQSDLNSAIFTMAQQDKSVNPNDPATRKRVLDFLINEKLIVAKAIEDSVVASDEEIQQRWEAALSSFIKMYGSEKRIEDVYGMSIARMQYEYRDEIRNQILSDKLKQQKFGDLKVNQKDVEEFYNQYKDSLPQFPAQVELYHIVKNVQANYSSKEKILALAKSVRDSILRGGDFADFAKRYSGDPGTAPYGGELGWFEKGKFFPEFEKAAFALQIGEISAPVETPFGYHLIQTLNKNKDSVLTRHILFKVGVSDEDKEKAKQFLISLKDSVKNGANFEDLARKYSDEKETAGFGGFLNKFPVNQVPQQVNDIISKLPDGGISDPVQYSPEPKLSYDIIWKKRTIPEHKPDLTTDYKDLERYAISYKQNKLFADWIETLRKSMYWEIIG